MSGPDGDPRYAGFPAGFLDRQDPVAELLSRAGGFTEPRVERRTPPGREDPLYASPRPGPDRYSSSWRSWRWFATCRYDPAISSANSSQSGFAVVRSMASQPLGP